MARKFKIKPHRGYISAPFFGIIVICFFLPFVLVSCPQEHNRSVTGIEMTVIGKYIPKGEFNAFTPAISLGPKEFYFGTIAFACAIAGIVFSFLNKKYSFFACIAAAAAGVLFMILLQNQVVQAAARTNPDNIRYYYQQGYWLALTFFIVAGVVTILLFISERIKFKLPFKFGSSDGTRKVTRTRTRKTVKKVRKRK